MCGYNVDNIYNVATSEVYIEGFSSQGRQSVSKSREFPQGAVLTRGRKMSQGRECIGRYNIEGTKRNAYIHILNIYIYL